jgi:hypothetical protein
MLDEPAINAFDDDGSATAALYCVLVKEGYWRERVLLGRGGSLHAWDADRYTSGIVCNC